MSQLSKRLEQIVKKELSKNIIPIKTKEGILVGEILIVNEGSLKYLYKNAKLLYSEIHLNSIAIKMANILALRNNSISVDKLFKADQEYGKWYADSQLLRAQYQKSISNRDYDRADMLWARYQESRDRMIQAKNQAESLLRIE